ncbi:PREDICTED: odorant receptor 49b-like [Rhagoletis zephyria]|uniref:odorant receptor 49b-like n=1 Tax=Rhagoletis zephyria TaxID=28612 RepID=UPI0008119FA5|nr:PREDICTED: odorant receptor 49b-like [Rhagoletis zephyria]
MYFCEQLYNINLVYMKRVGSLGDPKRALFMLAMPTFCCFATIYRIYQIWHNFDEVVANFFKVSGMITITIRTFMVLSKQKKFLDFFNDIDNWYHRLRSENDEVTMKNLEEYTRKTRRASKTIFGIMIVCIFYISAIQLLTSISSTNKKYIIEVRLPFVDLYTSPYYEIISVLQALWLAPIVLLSYVSYLCVILISISFGIFLMKDLQQKLGNMHELNELEGLECIKKCIQQHVLIIKFHRDLEVLFSAGNFVDVSIFCIIPCVIIVYANMEYNLAFMITDVQLVFVVIFSTYIIFWLANSFYIEGLNIAHAAYNCNWVDRGKDFRKYIVVIMTVGQKPLELTAGGLKPVNMQFFLAIVRVSYSIFTVLQGTKKDY